MERLAEILFSQAGAVAGVLFIVILGLCYTLRILWKDYKEMQKRHEQRNMQAIEEAIRCFERVEGTIREQTRTIEIVARSSSQ